LKYHIVLYRLPFRILKSVYNLINHNKWFISGYFSILSVERRDAQADMYVSKNKRFIIL